MIDPSVPKNAIIHGIPEPNGRDARARVEQDNGSVNSIFQSLNLSNLQVTKVIRIGKQSPDKSGPVKVAFKDAKDAISFFKTFHPDSCKEICPGCKIDVSRDRTPIERSYLAELRNTLDARSKADPLNCVHTPASRVMLSLMELYDLQQVNSIYNGRGVLLDLVLCTNKNTIVSLEIDALLPAEERHHPPLSIILHCSNRNTKGCTTKHFKPDFTRCNLWETCNSLSVVDFTAVLSSTDLNEATEKFLSTIAEAVRLNSPLRRVGVSPFPRWFSAETKDLVIAKQNSTQTV
ncbi:hypothetical protein J6590_049376 [Homalodisca vitripennis]|nr:hypothetical protein J6590_049376 [Homalodisca vitripennis]